MRITSMHRIGSRCGLAQATHMSSVEADVLAADTGASILKKP